MNKFFKFQKMFTLFSLILVEKKNHNNHFIELKIMNVLIKFALSFQWCIISNFNQFIFHEIFKTIVVIHNHFFHFKIIFKIIKLIAKSFQKNSKKESSTSIKGVCL